MTTVNGLDVFHGDGPVDWASVAAAGIEFAYVKASEGVAVTDSRFAQNWKAMKEAGVMRGAYHFFHPASSPEDQAGHFLAVMSDFSEGDLPRRWIWRKRARRTTNGRVFRRISGSGWCCDG